jgi:hypothetical protein
MLTDPFAVLRIRYPPVVYVNSSSHRFSIMFPPVVMLAAPLTVLSIRYPPVVYVSSPSHSFKHKVSTSSLCLQPLSQFEAYGIQQ